MNDKSTRAGRRRLWTAWLWAVLLSFAQFAHNLRAAETEWDVNENYVLQITANGRSVNLENAPPAIRKISGKLFQRLLTLPKDRVTPEGVRISHAIVDEDENGNLDLALPNLEVPYAVRFEHCEFRGKMDLSGCRFAKGVSFEHSVFKADTRFERLQVEGHLDLREAVFERAFDAPYASISDNLLGGGARFQGLASFKEINVGHSIDFSSLDDAHQTLFNRDLDWSGSVVGHNFLAWNVRFDGNTRFDSLKVGGTVWMQDCRFGAGMSFGYARIGDDLDASSCQFTNALKKANFYGLHCGSLKLDKAVFTAQADFGNAAIANDLSLCMASFENKKPTSFYAASVKGSAYFNDAKFLGPANFILAQVEGNFSAAHARFLDATDLNEIQNPGQELQSTFNADFGSLTVNGFTFFNDASFAGDISFRNARIQNLVFDRVQWPAKEKSLRLEGLSYQRIRSITNQVFVLNLEDLRKSWLNLKGTLGQHTPFSFDVYENLEAYFLREGQPELADDVFIEGKRRERREADLTSKWWNIFLDLTVGHGRKPSRAFLISLVPLLVGAMCFKLANMKPSNSSKKPEDLPYNSFWFSLDLFLPILGLWIKDEWEPRADRKWVWAYACVHKFIGWVLVPVGLAAFAGIVK